MKRGREEAEEESLSLDDDEIAALLATY